MPYPAIDLINPAAGATVGHVFSADGTAQNADGSSAGGEVWFQSQKSSSTNNVIINNNAWSGLNFSLPSSWAGGANLKVFIVGTQASDIHGITISSS